MKEKKSIFIISIFISSFLTIFVILTNCPNTTPTDSSSSSSSNSSSITPIINSITPNIGKNNGTINITNLSGSGFKSGAIVKLTKSGQSDIVATNIDVVNTAMITCSFNLNNKEISYWKITVTNTDDSTIKLRLTKDSRGGYYGPRGEHYAGWPSMEKLWFSYGF